MNKKLLKASIDPLESDEMLLLFDDESTDTIELYYPDQYTVALDDGESLTHIAMEERDIIYNELKRFAIVELNKPNKEELEPLPKYNKDWVQRIVRLDKSMQNKGGEFFPEGTLMVVSKRSKKDATLHLRPIKGSIIVSESDCSFIGSKVHLGFNNRQ